MNVEYTNSNRVNRVKDSAVSPNWRVYSHDARGNVTNDDIHTFTYDYANQPITIGGTDSGTYAYDGNLKRVKQVVGGQTIYSIYDRAGALLTRDNATTNAKTDYLAIAGQTFVRIRNNVASYPLNDHLGTAFAVAAQNGTIPASQTYNTTPFGEAWGAYSPGDDNEQGYTGHIEDATGLTYMQARYYDPVMGRFLSTDPVGYLDQLNLYAYVHNDPVNMVDPDGEFALLGAVIGAGFQIHREIRNGSFKGGVISKEGAKALARIGGSAAVGAVTGGVGGIVSKSVVGLSGKQLATTVAANATRNGVVGGAAAAAGHVSVNTAEIAIDSGLLAAGEAIVNDTVLAGAVGAAANGAAFGALGSVAGDVVSTALGASVIFGEAGTLSPAGSSIGVATGNAVGNLSSDDFQNSSTSDAEQTNPCKRGTGRC